MLKEHKECLYLGKVSLKIHMATKTTKLFISPLNMIGTNIYIQINLLILGNTCQKIQAAWKRNVNVKKDQALTWTNKWLETAHMDDWLLCWDFHK